LKEQVVQNTLWAAEFSLIFADDFARTGDVPNTVACMTRIYHYLVQALFAINETYFLNDKRVLGVMDGFARCPPDFGARISAILGHAGSTSARLVVSANKIRSIFEEVAELTTNAYRPKFAAPK
jgi:hypothetical protein